MARKIEVQIVGDADSLHRALGKATDTTSRFGRIAGGAARAGVIALGAGAVGAAVGITKLVEAGSDMNETINKSNVVFGRSSKSVQEWSASMAEAGGISQQAALDAVSTFGTFGKAAGVSKGKLDTWSESLVQAASDLASFHNADPSQVLEDLRSGLAGEVEPLRKYGILLNDATLRQQAMKMGLVDSTKNALSPNNKMLAAQALILKDLGPAAGDFARTSGGLANQQRILKAELSNVVSQLGYALLPIVVKVATFAIPLVISAVKAVANAIKGAIKWVSQIASHFQILGGKSATAGDRIHTAWSAVVNFFREHVMPIIRQLRNIFQDAMKAIAQTVQQHGDEIHRIAVRVGTALSAIATAAMPLLRTALVKVLPKAIGLAITALDKITNTISTVVNWIETLINDIHTLGDAINKLPGLPFDVNKGLLDNLGIDPNKGLLNQDIIFGGGGGGTRSGGNVVIPVHIDGREVFRAVVQQDKVFRRQNGRGALA